MRQANTAPANLQQLHHTMRGYVARGEVPGLVYLIEQNGNLAVESIGQRSFDGPEMTRDTLFRIASMTKPIVAVATMDLIEDGLLGLDDPVDTWLPELSGRKVLRRVDSPLDDTVPASRPITARDLLTFRWGFGIVMAPPDSYPIQQAMTGLELGQGPPDPARLPEPDEWIRRLGTLPLIHQPGDRWMYNTGSDVLGLLISRATGKSLEDVLIERIFKPLGMRDTRFHVPPEETHRFATCYGYDGETEEFEVSDPPERGQWNQPPPFQSGAAGLVSTVDDYLAFARMLLHNGAINGQAIISPSSVRLMTTDHLNEVQRADAEPIVGSGNSWGLGVSVRASNPQSPGRYGWNGGFGTHWFNDRASGVVAILLTQASWSCPAFRRISLDFQAGVDDVVRT